MNTINNHSDRRARRHRRGYVLIATIICLSVVMVLVTAWVRTVVREHQFVQTEVRAVRAEYLAASGVERGLARLAADPDYTGETWRIDPQTLGARDAASVAIEVVPAADDTTARRIRAVADFPDQGPTRVRRTRETGIPMPINEEPS